MKRIIALLLVAVTSLALFSCTDGGQRKSNAPEKVALENVYLTEKFALPKDKDIYNICISGDRIYCRGSINEEYTDENGNVEYRYIDKVYVADTAFTEFKDFYSYESKNFWDDVTMESSSEYFNNIHSDGMGGLWISIASYSSKPANEDKTEWLNDNNTILYHYDADGNLTRTLDCKELLAKEAESTAETVANFYINAVAQAKDGTLYILTSSELVAVAPDDTVSVKEFKESTNVNNVAVLDDGTLRAVSYDWTGEESKAIVIELAPGADEFKNLCELSVNDTIMMDADGTVYVDDYYVVSRIDLATGEADPVLDWINSDINCDKIFQTHMLNGDVYTFEWDNEYENRSLLRLTPAGDGEVIEKYVITLAANTIPSNLKSMVIDYNRSSADYRIQVKAYGWEESDSDRFDMDLLAGNVPDIISLDQLNAEKYATKGIFADLGALLDADEDISREDFLPNVLDAASIKGKLYRLPTSFSIRSLMGKKSVLGDKTSWTWDDFINVMKQYPDAEMLSEYTRETLMNEFLPAIIEDFIDYDNGKSNFTDGSFARFLEYAKTLPQEIDWESYYENIDWEEYEDRYKNNKALLAFVYLSSLDGEHYTAENFGEPVSYIGFPTSSGNGNALYFSSQFAIGENSVYKEQAWDFLKMVFEENYQTEYIWEIPVIKSAFEKMKQEAIDNANGLNNEKDYPVFDDMIMPDEEIIIEDAVTEEIVVDEAVTEEIIVEEDAAESSFILSKDAVIGMPKPVFPSEEDNLEERKAKMLDNIEQTCRIATTANRLVRFNDPMIEVIAGECSAYFDGKKSIEETCKIIESRVNLYLAENM